MNLSVTEAMDARLDALHKLDTDVMGRMVTYAEHQKGSGNKHWLTDAPVMLRMEREMLTRAEPFVWSPDIAHAVQQSSASLPFDVPFSREWLHADVGWWWFGKDSPLTAYCLIGYPANPLQRRISALAYAFDPARRSLILAAYSYDHAEPTRGPVPVFGETMYEGQTLNEMLASISTQFVADAHKLAIDVRAAEAATFGTGNLEMSRLGHKLNVPHLRMISEAFAHAQQHPEFAGQTLPEIADYFVKHPDRVKDFSFSALAWSDASENVVAQHRDSECKTCGSPSAEDGIVKLSFSEVYMQSARLWLPFFCAAGLWLSQKLIVAEGVPVERHARKRSAAVGIEARASVIHLRRRVYMHDAAAEGEGVEMERRHYNGHWVVRGFWRNQFYPSTGAHKPKWIDSYTKGDQSLPLTGADRVFVVNR